MITLDTKKQFLPACPVSGTQRDNTIARLVALFTLVAATTVRALVALDYLWPALILLTVLSVDFAIRAFHRPRFSPLATGGRAVASGLNLKSELVDAAPKIFAARIGLLFTLSAAILLAFGFTGAAMWIVVILSLCAFAEAAFSFCVACRIYQYLPQHVSRALARDFAA